MSLYRGITLVALLWSVISGWLRQWSKECGSGALRYRTLDGSCNNLRHMDWGKSFEAAKRLVKPAYQDGQNLPRTHGRDGQPLMSVRYISKYVCRDVTQLSIKSVFDMAWGQYIDHDVTGFPVMKLNSSDLQCCSGKLDKSMMSENGGPCFTIEIPSDDGFFNGKKCMEFIRSSPAMEANDNQKIPREQVNGLTAYIDASTVYGSDGEFTKKYKLSDGTLKTHRNNMLPDGGKRNCKIVNSTTDYCLDAGDHRVNVFVGLGMFHTVFHREHNRLVQGLREVNPHWTPQRLFDEARKINGALHQHITYSEYLPSFLPPEIMLKYGLQAGTPYTYDDSTNPQMANAFSTAAFRFGHSQIQKFVRVGKDIFPTQDTLMRPHLVLTRLEEVIEGLALHRAEDVDHFFAKAVTERMFEKEPAKRDGLDLVAINTQRGRDHGLAPYNEYRMFCGLPPMTSFVNDPLVRNGYELSHVYRHVDDIDLFIGGVSEHPLPGSIVGPTFACILAQQFHDLKFGDRFFYETTRSDERFTLEQLKEIKLQTIAAVICANTDVRELQPNILFIPDIVSNPMIPCSSFPKIDLKKWKDLSGVKAS